MATLSEMMGAKTEPETTREQIQLVLGGMFKLRLDNVAKLRGYPLQNVPPLIFGEALWETLTAYPTIASTISSGAMDVFTELLNE